MFSTTVLSTSLVISGPLPSGPRPFHDSLKSLQEGLGDHTGHLAHLTLAPEGGLADILWAA